MVRRRASLRPGRVPPPATEQRAIGSVAPVMGVPADEVPALGDAAVRTPMAPRDGGERRMRITSSEQPGSPRDDKAQPPPAGQVQSLRPRDDPGDRPARRHHRQYLPSLPEHTYRAVFSDVTGLEKGDDIRVAGCGSARSTWLGHHRTGRWRRSPSPSAKARPLLNSTGAVSRYRNLAGPRYVALTEGAGDGKPADGAQIPLSRTQPALDLNALLNGFKPLFAALSPRTSTSSPARSSEPFRARAER